MKFRTLKASIVTLLGAAAAGRFKVVSYQRQTRPADEGNTVQVYYQSGSFPKTGAAVNGTTRHEITFKIDLKVSESAKGDLTVIQDPDATPAQLAVAIAAFQDAAALADSAFDQLADDVYNILMDARNQDLGLAEGSVSNRFIANINKEDPLPRGEVVVLTGTMNLTCVVDEEILGDLGTTVPVPIYDSTIELNDDSVALTGVQIP